MRVHTILIHAKQLNERENVYVTISSLDFFPVLCILNNDKSAKKIKFLGMSLSYNKKYYIMKTLKK